MENAETMKFIKKQIARWSYLAVSYGWKFDVLYAANDRDMPEGYDNCYGACFHLRDYLDADIWFNLERCAKLDESKLEEVVIHEITHLVLAPMQNKQNKAETERVTTMVSRLFKGLRQATDKARKEAKNGK